MGAACPTAVFAAKFSFLDRRVLILTASLAGALLVGAILIALVDRWRKRAANETFSTHDQLASFRLLYERGEMTQEEYDRVRQQLLVRLKKGPPPLPAKAPPSPPPADPPPPSEPGTNVPGSGKPEA